MRSGYRARQLIDLPQRSWRMSVAHALLPERQARSERRHESSSNTERRLSIELPRLMNQIETHAKQLSDQVIQAVRTSPRTRLMGRLSEEELKARFFELFRNFGRRRCREGMPLNELIYALIVVKQHVWGYVLKNVMPASEGNLYEEELPGEMLGKFFDRALYHTIRGYEEVWSKEASLRLLAGPPAEAGSATTGIARAILGELDARRGVLDNDR